MIELSVAEMRPGIHRLFQALCGWRREFRLFKEPFKSASQVELAMIRARRDEWEEDILRAGGATMRADYSSVWPGTWGHTVAAMAEEGLLEKRIVRGPLSSDDLYVYSLTEAGRSRLEVIVSKGLDAEIASPFPAEPSLLGQRTGPFAAAEVAAAEAAGPHRDAAVMWRPDRHD